jgi:hypothetical protein
MQFRCGTCTDPAPLLLMSFGRPPHCARCGLHNGPYLELTGALGALTKAAIIIPTEREVFRILWRGIIPFCAPDIWIYYIHGHAFCFRGGDNSMCGQCKDMILCGVFVHVRRKSRIYGEEQNLLTYYLNGSLISIGTLLIMKLYINEKRFYNTQLQWKMSQF